jgi:hypothetical protein
LAQTRIAASRAAKSQREGSSQQADALRAECDLIAKAIVKASSKSKPIAGTADVPES